MDEHDDAGTSADENAADAQAPVEGAEAGAGSDDDRVYDADHPEGLAPPAAGSTGNVAEGGDDADPLDLARARIAAALDDHGPATVGADGAIAATVAGVPVTITVASAAGA